MFENTADSDQLASKVAIWLGSTLSSTLLTTGMLQVNKIKHLGEIGLQFKLMGKEIITILRS